MGYKVNKSLHVCFTGKSPVTVPTWISNLDLSDTSGVTCLVQKWPETRGSGNHYFCFQNTFYIVNLLIHGNVCAIAPDPLQHHILARVDRLRLKPCG